MIPKVFGSHTPARRGAGRNGICSRSRGPRRDRRRPRRLRSRNRHLFRRLAACHAIGADIVCNPRGGIAMEGEHGFPALRVVFRIVDGDAILEPAVRQHAQTLGELSTARNVAGRTHPSRSRRSIRRCVSRDRSASQCPTGKPIVSGSGGSAVPAPRSTMRNHRYQPWMNAMRLASARISSGYGIVRMRGIPGPAHQVVGSKEASPLARRWRRSV